jgi:3-oxoacyl-[acyl-carrier-protein] synthase-1
VQPLAILASGMVTAVGLTAPASCAAIRAGIDNFAETRFIDSAGEWIVGSQVPLEQSWRGLPKLVQMVVPAIRECLARADNVDPEQIPLLLCVAERGRPGRLEGVEEHLLKDVQDELGLQFHENSGVMSRGRVGGVFAVRHAQKLIHQVRHPLCIIAGADTFLLATTLSAYEARDRLLTSKNSNGFIPGEAGAAVLLGPASRAAGPNLIIQGIGFGEEKATIDSEEPLRADGLVQAIREALSDAKLSMGDLDYRITSVNGEQYWFKEAALALTRILRERKEEFDIWHAADCIGEVGAAVVPCSLSVALAAARKEYASGDRVLCHFSNDDGLRAAMILISQM